MLKTIEKFILNGDTGLMLLSVPTGAGKTYNALKFIINNFEKDEYKNKKFFFITTQKKNLPHKEAIKLIEDEEIKKRFIESSIFLDANSVEVEKNILNTEVSSWIAGLEEYRNLKNEVEFLKSIDKDKEKSHIYQRSKKYIFEKLEPEFRRKIQRELYETFESAEMRYKAILSDSKYKGIKKLYPAYESINKKIFFLTVDKFILGNSTLIEPTYRFHNSDIINNGIIFIDEFDATKKSILDIIIRSNMGENIDYLKLFLNIYNNLKDREFPQDLIYTGIPDGYGGFDKVPNENIEKSLESLEKKCEDIYEKYNMEFNFKANYAEGEEPSRTFIFNDLNNQNIVSGDEKEKRFLRIRTSKEDRMNFIEFSDEIPKDNENMLYMLLEIMDCVEYFKSICNLLSSNYRNNISRYRGQEGEDYKIEYAIKSVLNNFRLDDKVVEHIFNEIMLKQDKRNKKEGILSKKELKELLIEDKFDLSVYNNGFRYFEIIDSPENNMHSQVKIYEYNEFPEHIIAKIADKAKVIGMSATATVNTITKNYDLDYFRKKLKENFYSIPQKDKERMQENFRKSISKYVINGVKIDTERVCTDDNLKNELKEIIDDQKISDKFWSEIEIYLEDEYNQDKFLKIIKVLKEFIVDEDAKSFLCLTNSLARKEGAKYNLNLIRDIAQFIIEKNKIEGLDAKSLVQSVESYNFEDDMDRIGRSLMNGEKIFLMSSYNTLGAGQNIQYTVPDLAMNSIIPINKYSERKIEEWKNEKNEQEKLELRKDIKKDFDGIYLENPTYLISNLYSDFSYKNLPRGMYEVEYFLERGELSLFERTSFIKRALGKVSNKFSESKYMNDPRYRTYSNNNAAMTVLIQAIGRLCRTGIKNKLIKIRVDDDILEKYSFKSLGKDLIVSPEFQSLIKLYEKEGKKENIKSEKTNLKNLAITKSQISNSRIKGMLKKWDEHYIFMWKKLRDFVLKNPTISKENLDKNLEFEVFYMKMPEKDNKYFYEQKGDFAYTDIKFNGDKGSYKFYEVSQESARLEEVLKVDYVKKAFEENGYSMKFEKNEFIMTPIVFNNIYKGALGEISGKVILEAHLKENLKEIENEEHFELFDYTLGNGIYFDFKFWHESFKRDSEYEIKKALRKLKKCGGKRVFIINILVSGEIHYTDTSSYGGKIIEIPYLYNLKTGEINTDLITKYRAEGLFN